MATAFLSDQETLISGSRKLDTGHVGKPYRVMFTKTLAASGLATGDTVALCRLPAGAVVTHGEFCWSATQGATATTAIGIAGTAAKYFAAAVTASTAKFPFVATQALGYGAELTADEIVIATNAAAAWTASSVLRGHIDYLL
jgi:hypothetical protein